MRQRKPAYENLKFYQDICAIRMFIHKVTERFRKNNLRLVEQMRDSARSAKQNIREGYRKGTVGEFSHSINISLGSLEELSGDIEDCKDDGLITNEEFNEFAQLFQSATYMASQYIKSLFKMEREGTWKVPFSSYRKKKHPATLRNLH